MKAMKKYLLLLTVFAMLFTLAACADDLAEVVEEEPAMTAEILVEKIADAMEGREMTTACAAMTMDASVSAEGMTMDMAMAMELDMIASADPYASYVEMDMDITMLGETMGEHCKVYTVVEDGKLMNYTYMEAYDYWSVEEAGEVDEAALAAQSDYNWLAEKDPASLKLAEETETLNGRETYVLNCTITGDEMNQAMGMMQDSLADAGMEGMDLTGADIPVTIWVDAETFLVVQMDLDMMAMGTFINDMIGSLTGLEDTPAMINFNEFTYIFTDMGYDDVTVPAVPEEAKEATSAQDGLFDLPLIDEVPTSADECYTIEEGNYQVQIACPEGWYVDEVAYDSLSITRNDEMAMGYYLMFGEGDKETFVSLIEEDVVQSCIDDGTYVDHGAGEPVRGMHTMWLTTSDGYTMYFAFGDAYGGWLYVDVVDATGVDLETALTELLDAIVRPGDAI